jgi:multidrug resistance efflux pump
MKSSAALFLALFLTTPPISGPAVVSAQEMDTLDGIYRGQYQQLKLEENGIQQRVQSLKDLKSGIDDLIGQVTASSADSYALEADRYRQLQLLLPSAIKYCEELDQAQKRFDQLQQKKAELRSKILERQSSLPVWWSEE